MARIEALANPALLRWARISAGYEIPTAAKRIGVKPEQVEDWEAAAKRPTFGQLRKMAAVYKRPVAVFFLSEHPTDFQALRDFRRLPSLATPGASPELTYEMRRAQERRDLALELFEPAEDEEPPSFALTASLSDEPETAAARIRSHLGVTYEMQASWEPTYESFGGWRSAIEESGVLVFQATDVPLGEMRGFSIYADKLPAIVVNIKDSVRGRTFTLLHELAHLALRQTGVCLLQEIGRAGDELRQIEVYCNRVAGAALVPAGLLLAQPVVAAQSGFEWDDAQLTSLANRFGVSREVVLRRLLILGRTTEEFYQQRRERFEAEYVALAGRSGGFAPPHRMAISAGGPLFVRLVLGNYQRDSITASDVADFLGVRLKHLRQIEAEVTHAG